MEPKVEQLRARLVEINEACAAITARADAENGRDLTEEENAQLSALLTEFKARKAELEQREAIERQRAELAAGTGRRTEPESADAPRRHTVPAVPIDRKAGFHSLGDFAGAVIKASAAGGVVDPRLAALAPSSYANEGQGGEGGFLVPPDFRTEIYTKVMGEESILSRTDQLTTSSNSITLPIDETTPWDTSKGIQAYWEGEAAQYTQSKPAVEGKNIRLNKLVALVPVTEELMEDAPALTSYLRRKAPEKMNFKISLALMQGTGVGMPLGVLKAPSTVSIAKENSQVADTIVWENLQKMWSRMYAPCRARAVWMINQDIEPQLFSMRFLTKNVAGTENVSGVPVYMPANGAAGQPYGTLFGRPIVPTEACETLGDKGDIALVDWSQYLTVQRTGGMRQDVSIHLWFDYDTTAFKFTMRVAGRPWWNSAITPRDSSNTRSWAVTLDERS